MQDVARRSSSGSGVAVDGGPIGSDDLVQKHDELPADVIRRRHDENDLEHGVHDVVIF